MEHLTDQQLNAYLDHLLDGPIRKSLQAHLSQCVKCQSRLDEMKLVFADLEGLADIPMPRDLTPLIMASLPEREPAPVWTRGFAAQSGIVAGMLFWLGIQAIPFIRFPSLAFPDLPIMEIETLLTRLLALHYKVHFFDFPEFHFQLPVIQFQTPAIYLPIPTSYLVTLAILSLLLWVTGNLILLRCRQEPQS